MLKRLNLFLNRATRTLITSSGLVLLMLIVGTLRASNALAAPMGSFEEASLALAKTQSFVQQRDSQSPPPRLLSPLESLKHDNMHQLERKAGPMFGRFYDERKLLNNPPEHTARGPESTAAQSAKASSRGTAPDTPAAVSSPKQKAPAAKIPPARETGALNFLEHAQPDSSAIDSKPYDSEINPVDQKIKSTHTGVGTSLVVPASVDQPPAVDKSGKSNLSDLAAPQTTRLSSTETVHSAYRAGAVDARAIASPSKRGVRVPGWVRRIERIDEPVNELQLFVPKP